ncbi:hypothetical protein T459_15595 [Capsicum annuum]|uniref:Uncharacterized protein n=1 Tax=Capsicum annuum TaxID=4072 RepID=A0A2G2ZKQ8_CAPAN|nr:hypothetical protein T459_15595 [Capsicum annuum]
MDAIAFACSAGAIFRYFYMATNPRPMFYQDLDYLWSLSKVGARSQLVAMSAVVIAFVTGHVVNTDTPEASRLLCPRLNHEEAQELDIPIKITGGPHH